MNCPTCTGRGYRVGRDVPSWPCNTCKGTGHVADALPVATPNACEAQDDGAGAGFMMCPGCGGSGDGPDRIDGPGDVYQATCPECDGNGRVPRATPSSCPTDKERAGRLYAEAFPGARRSAEGFEIQASRIFDDVRRETTEACAREAKRIAHERRMTGLVSLAAEAHGADAVAERLRECAGQFTRPDSEKKT